MNGLFEAGLEVQQFMEHRKWAFCFIGAVAVLRWGQARMTMDIDLSLFADYGKETGYIDPLLSNFESRISNPVEFALKNRVLLLRASNKVSVDISLAALPFERRMIERSTLFQFAPDCPLLICSAEDLIVQKAFADRAKDWLDLEGIILRQGRALDVPYILESLEPLCMIKEAPEILDKLHRILDVLKL
ncbi:MAG TPA: nucleotidyl transferase AbiEii/AbiGii toxin family protein [Thermodesulfovibrionia bacterium]|nr:nucleotidyl transferase AbiEii/AbiGii toxin family protein [Thermodesulfovibrionia bacterium]